MSFDAWVVGFGISTLLHDLKLVESNAAYLVLVGVVILDTWLLYRFFAITLPALKLSDPKPPRWRKNRRPHSYRPRPAWSGNRRGWDLRGL